MESGQIPGPTSPVDRGEPISRMEPLRIAEGSRHRGELADLTLDLATRSARFQASLPPGLVRPLADAVRAVNCYYSNLIEGHEEALAEFTRFFLNVCIDQVTFMQTLMQPEQLRARVLIWAEEEIRLGSLPARADRLLEVFLYRGQIARSEVVSLLGMAERTARRISSALLQRGVLTSESPKAPLTLAFPATLAGRWMPGLFPERPSR
jgi:hypothetical protein